MLDIPPSAKLNRGVVPMEFGKDAPPGAKSSISPLYTCNLPTQQFDMTGTSLLPHPERQQLTTLRRGANSGIFLA